MDFLLRGRGAGRPAAPPPVEKACVRGGTRQFGDAAWSPIPRIRRPVRPCFGERAFVVKTKRERKEFRRRASTVTRSRDDSHDTVEQRLESFVRPDIGLEIVFLLCLLQSVVRLGLIRVGKTADRSRENKEQKRNGPVETTRASRCAGERRRWRRRKSRVIVGSRERKRQAPQRWFRIGRRLLTQVRRTIVVTPAASNARLRPHNTTTTTTTTSSSSSPLLPPRFFTGTARAPTPAASSSRFLPRNREKKTLDATVVTPFERSGSAASNSWSADPPRNETVAPTKRNEKKIFFSPRLSRTEESRPERPAPVAAPPARPPSVDSGRSRFCRETPPHIGNPTLPYTSSGPKRPVFIFFLENLPTDSKTVSILAYLSPRRIRSTIADLHSTDPAGAKNSGTPKNARFFRYDPFPTSEKYAVFRFVIYAPDFLCPIHSSFPISPKDRSWSGTAPLRVRRPSDAPRPGHRRLPRVRPGRTSSTPRPRPPTPTKTARKHFNDPMRFTRLFFLTLPIDTRDFFFFLSSFSFFFFLQTRS